MADRINPATGSYDFLTWMAKLENASTEQLAMLVLAHREGSDIGDAAFSVLSAKLGSLRAAHAAVAAERDLQAAEAFGSEMEQVWSEVRAAL